MKFEAWDEVDVPIVLTIALAKDDEEHWIVLHLHDGAVRGGYLMEVDRDEVRIQDESGDEPWGETHSWNEVAKVVIP